MASNEDYTGRRFVTDRAEDEDANNTRRLKYDEDARPVPPGIAWQFWSRIYNRVDSRGRRSAQARLAGRRSGETYRTALRDLATELAGAERRRAGASRHILEVTRDRLDTEFLQFMGRHGIVFDVASYEWAEEQPSEDADADADADQGADQGAAANPNAATGDAEQEAGHD